MSMSHSQRLPLIDLLKVVAAQLIVLHHLAFYGPMADHAAPLMPRLIDWLADPARMVVQVFLVVGGYLAALSLAPDGRVRTPTQVTSRLLERYLRLALPLTLALLLAIVAAAVARNCMEHPSVPVAPSPMQFFAHLLLLQDVIGKEALSAGIWYVAIDLQLYASLLLWLGLVVALLKQPDRVRQVLPWGVVVAVAWSAVSVNRQSSWDIWAPYFFAAYGLGVLTAWAREGHSARIAFLLALVSVMLGLWLEWRDRLAIAALVAVLLWASHGIRSRIPHRSVDTRSTWLDALHYLGQISYATFLVHFPVSMVINALFTAYVPPAAGLQAVGVLLAWGCSIVAGSLFHHVAEAPLMRLVSRCKASGWGWGQRRQGALTD
jgi:peptidoglycan/LPS O-acetylase OafA/YrhL